MEIDVRDLPYYIRVARVSPLPGHRIDVEFEDGNRGIYDMTPLLGEGIFRSLADDGLFGRVHVSFGVVTWSDEIDISSERLWTDCDPSARTGARGSCPTSTSRECGCGPGTWYLVRLCLTAQGLTGV